jgi:hypothetical protein
MFFEYPDVRFSGRFDRTHRWLRAIALLLFRWLKNANADSVRISSRRHEAKFRAATQIAYQLLVETFRGWRATDRASNDALRPHDNWVKPEDQYDISIIGEKWPALARRLPQKGRLSLAQPERARKGAGEEIILGKNYGVFFRWKTGTTLVGAIAEWIRALPLAA